MQVLYPVRFCDLLWTPYASASKIPSVKVILVKISGVSCISMLKTFKTYCTLCLTAYLSEAYMFVALVFPHGT